MGGQPQWLTIPIQGHGHREKTIKDMQVAGTGWAADHWRKIRNLPTDQLLDSTIKWSLSFRPFFEKIAKEKFLIDVSLQASGSSGSR